MRYYSTRDNGKEKKLFSLKEAAVLGLAPDGGLFMPEYIPSIDMDIVLDLYKKSYADMALYLAKSLFPSVDAEKLENAVREAYNFPIKMKSLGEGLHTLELFHGPTYAFKDFGARFMGQMMGILNNNEDVIVLTATSGDTGSAVAGGFYGVKGVKVVVLYPGGKISSLQEAQMTTLHNNIYPLKVNGTFDDCQRMVKSMFSDKELRSKIDITSANSINILRWIPQSFYYFYGYCAWKELTGKDNPTVVVPSGNYGNLTAGMLAKRMGVPIKDFVAASNANRIIPLFLESGEYSPRPSIQTVANAMDVGAPSNYERMMELCGKDFKALKNELRGFSANDNEIIEEIGDIYSHYDYSACPHSSIGSLATKSMNINGFWLSTAHPAKFGEITRRAIGKDPTLSPEIKALLQKERKFTAIPNNESSLKSYLLNL